jgi:osmotically-inducible protein OsmY
MKTDKQLQEDVLAELAWESSVNAAHIGVEVDQGVVTLSGHVDTYAEKWGAERAAKRVKGTRAVAIEVDVKLRSSEKRTDSDIALSAVNAMQWVSIVPKDAIHVAVENGMISLSGDVFWNYQRNAAAGAVRNLAGVRGVINQILVKPRVNVAAIKGDIEAALKRHAALDAKQIAVTLDGDTITLSVSG